MADTGAREPHDQRLLREAADWLHQRAKESPVPAEMGAWVDAIDRALAAGVGVPPDAEPADVQRRLNTHTDSELTRLLADVSIAAALRRDVPPHQVLREALAFYGWPESDWPKVREHVKGWLAGVGEARPAEPPTDPARDIAAEYAAYPEVYSREPGQPQTEDELLAEVGRDPDRLMTLLRDTEAECGRLREQLDAADKLLASAYTFLERSGESDGHGGQVIASNVLPGEIFNLAEAASEYERARAALEVINASQRP